MNGAVILLGVALLAGATAAVASAGIGSMLTPLLALRLDFKVAVAIVAIAHLLGGVARLVPLRSEIDWRTVRTFGAACAAAALVGALLHDLVASVWLTRAFAALLILAGTLGLGGAHERLRPGTIGAWLGGASAGFAGGLVGEQGGIRAVGLLGFRLPRDAFVATSTAIGIAIDVARTPVYLAMRWGEVRSHWALLALATGGVLAGTGLGHLLLRRIPEKAFSRAVSAIVIAIGGLLFLRPPE